MTHRWRKREDLRASGTRANRSLIVGTMALPSSRVITRSNEITGSRFLSLLSTTTCTITRTRNYTCADSFAFCYSSPETRFSSGTTSVSATGYYTNDRYVTRLRPAILLIHSPSAETTAIPRAFTAPIPFVNSWNQCSFVHTCGQNSWR